MRIHKLIPAILAVAALLSVSCKYEPSMEESAIRAKIEEEKGEVSKFALTDIEMIGEVTLGEEIGIRRGVFELKHKKDAEYEQEYREKHFQKRADEKKAAMEKDLVHIARLDSILTTVSADLDKVVYRDYRFSASCMTSEGKLELKDWYACITPDGQVLSLVQDKKKLHRGVGIVIPGWKGLFSDDE